MHRNRQKNIIRFPKELQATKGHGEKPLFNHTDTENKEAEWMYSEIMKLKESNISLNKIAILYRAHYLTRPLEECFVQKGLTYKIYSGIEFYGRK